MQTNSNLMRRYIQLTDSMAKLIVSSCNNPVPSDGVVCRNFDYRKFKRLARTLRAIPAVFICMVCIAVLGITTWLGSSDNKDKKITAELPTTNIRPLEDVDSSRGENSSKPTDESLGVAEESIVSSESETEKDDEDEKMDYYVDVSDYEVDLLILAVQHETGHGVFDNYVQQAMTKVFLNQYTDSSFGNSSLYDTFGNTEQFDTLLQEVEYVKYCLDNGWDLEAAGVPNADLYNLYDQQTRENVFAVLTQNDCLPDDLVIECCSYTSDPAEAKASFYNRFDGPYVQLLYMVPRYGVYYDEYGNQNSYIINYVMFGTNPYGHDAYPS